MVLMDFVTHALPVEFSDFVQNPLVNKIKTQVKNKVKLFLLYMTIEKAKQYFLMA